MQLGNVSGNGTGNVTMSGGTTLDLNGFGQYQQRHSGCDRITKWHRHCYIEHGRTGRRINTGGRQFK